MNINDWSDQEKKQVGNYLQWNSYRSERHRLLYVATPKVACTTIKWWFASLEGYTEDLLRVVDNQESDPELVVHYSYQVAPHVNGLNFSEISLAIESHEYFRFAIVRNPYNRIFSAWQSKLLLREPLQVTPYLEANFFNYPIERLGDIAKAFEGFLEHLAENESPSFWDHHWTPQVDLLRPDLIDYSWLAKIEEADQLADKLRGWLGNDTPSPFRDHRSNESLIPYTPEFFTPRSIQLIRSMYVRDFEIFGYDKNIPSPKADFSTEECAVAIKAINVIRARHQILGERYTRITSLNQAVAERAGQIAGLSQAVVERDGEIAGLSQAVVERDGQIAGLNQAVIERDSQISSLVRTIEEIYRSYGWRALAPLRYFGFLGQQIAEFSRVLSLALAKAGGALPLLRIVLHVWRQDGIAGVRSLARQQNNHIPICAALPFVENNAMQSPGIPILKDSEDSVAGEYDPEILFVSHDASRTGAPVLLLSVARQLKQELGLGCVFLLCHGGELEAEFRMLGPVWVLANRTELPPLTLSAFKKRNIRLVYSNTGTNGLIQQKLKNLGCPILCHVHELGFSMEHHFGGANSKALFATTDYFLAGSGVVADYLIGTRKLPTEKVAIAHPFVDVEANLRALAQRGHRLDIPEGSIVIGACGTMGWRKGTDIFVHVARRVLELTKLPVHFVWIGGPLGSGDFLGLKYDVSVLGIEREITFAGAVNSHLPYLAQFDIFALPSREDPFPLVALDAASLGLPIVCFADAGGTPELLEADAGLVVPYLDVENMAKAIVRLAEDANLRRQLGDSVRAKVKVRHDIGIGGRKIAGIVQHFLNSTEKETV